MAPPTPTTTPMTVFRVLVDMPEGWAESPELRPGVEVVIRVVDSVVLRPSLLVRVTTSMVVMTTGVTVELGWLSPPLDEDTDEDWGGVDVIPGIGNVEEVLLVGSTG